MLCQVVRPVETDELWPCPNGKLWKLEPISNRRQNKWVVMDMKTGILMLACFDGVNSERVLMESQLKAAEILRNLSQ